MGRKAALTTEQVDLARHEAARGVTQKQLAQHLKVSIMTIGKVLRQQGAYKQSVLDLATHVETEAVKDAVFDVTNNEQTA